jgi:hypothetical protein
MQHLAEFVRLRRATSSPMQIRKYFLNALPSAVTRPRSVVYRTNFQCFQTFYVCRPAQRLLKSLTSKRLSFFLSFLFSFHHVPYSTFPFLNGLYRISAFTEAVHNQASYCLCLLTHSTHPGGAMMSVKATGRRPAKNTLKGCAGRRNIKN